MARYKYKTIQFEQPKQDIPQNSNILILETCSTWYE